MLHGRLVVARRLVKNGSKRTYESSTDEKGTEAPIDRLESVLQVSARAFGFTSNHGQILGPNNGKGSREEGAEKPLESSQGARTDVLGKGTWIVPIPKAEGIMLRVAADHHDEGEAEQHNDQEQLAGGKPKLNFTIILHSDNIEQPKLVSARRLTSARIKECGFNTHA